MDVNELKKKWVANIFKRRLQDNEISLPRKGLNFALSSHIVPPKDMFAIFEAVICHLRGKNQDATRAEA